MLYIVLSRAMPISEVLVILSSVERGMSSKRIGVDPGAAFDVDVAVFSSTDAVFGVAVFCLFGNTECA